MWKRNYQGNFSEKCPSNCMLDVTWLYMASNPPPTPRVLRKVVSFVCNFNLGGRRWSHGCRACRHTDILSHRHAATQTSGQRTIGHTDISSPENFLSPDISSHRYFVTRTFCHTGIVSSDILSPNFSLHAMFVEKRECEYNRLNLYPLLYIAEIDMCAFCA